MALNKLFKQFICAALLAISLAAPATLPVLADDGSNPAAAQPHSLLTTGIYVKDEFTLPVVQQPDSNQGFVSNVDGTVTQFGMAAQNGTIGLLAHNHLSGSEFFNLQLGERIYVFHGTDTIEIFVVTQVLQYQALSPHSPYSEFVDLSTGEKLSAGALFFKMYSGDRHLTLQTCIESGGEGSWGRLFVIAEPLVSDTEATAE